MILTNVFRSYVNEARAVLIDMHLHTSIRPHRHKNFIQPLECQTSELYNIHAQMYQKLCQIQQDALNADKILKRSRDPMYRHLHVELQRIDRAATSYRMQARNAASVYKKCDKSMNFIRKQAKALIYRLKQERDKQYRQEKVRKARLKRSVAAEKRREKARLHRKALRAFSQHGSTKKSLQAQARRERDKKHRAARRERLTT